MAGIVVGWCFAVSHRGTFVDDAEEREDVVKFRDLLRFDRFR